MAYMNFTELQGAPVAAPVDVAAVVGEVGFSALEWSVLLCSLATPGRLSIAFGTVFGNQSGSARLADPRLEALRRMSVLAWHHGDAVPRHEIRAFHQAGFTHEQYETLLDSISRGRSALNQGRRTR